MITRADKITEALKKEEVYSDFDISFTKHPVTGNLLRVTNENAVKQAVRNRILTMFGERPYLSFYGSNVKKSLFELNTAFTKEDIVLAIKNSLQNETRIDLLEVMVEDIEGENGYAITIYFMLINNTNPISVDIIIRRVR